MGINTKFRMTNYHLLKDTVNQQYSSNFDYQHSDARLLTTPRLRYFIPSFMLLKLNTYGTLWFQCRYLDLQKSFKPSNESALRRTHGRLTPRSQRTDQLASSLCLC